MITFLQLQNKPPKIAFCTLKNHLFSISGDDTFAIQMRLTNYHNKNKHSTK